MDPHRTPAEHWDWLALRRACRHEAHRLLRDPHDAEDAAQESLLRAWRQQTTCHSPEDPVAWARQIARREALRLLERRRLAAIHHAADGHAHLDGVPEPAGPDPEGRLDVRSAVRGLSAEDQLLVHARYVFDLTQPAAARLLGIPEGTAKVRLHRARGRLRRVLEPGETTLRRSSV